VSAKTDRITKLESGVSAKTERVAGLESVLDELRRVVDGSTVSDPDAAKTVITDGVRSLREAVCALEDAKRAQERRIADLEQTLKALRHSIAGDDSDDHDDVAGISRSISTRVGLLSSQLSQVEGSNAQQRARIAELEAALKSLRSRIVGSGQAEPDADGGVDCAALSASVMRSIDALRGANARLAPFEHGLLSVRKLIVGDSDCIDPDVGDISAAVCTARRRIAELEAAMRGVRVAVIGGDPEDGIGGEALCKAVDAAVGDLRGHIRQFEAAAAEIHAALVAAGGAHKQDEVPAPRRLAERVAEDLTRLCRKAADLEQAKVAVEATSADQSAAIEKLRASVRSIRGILNSAIVAADETGV
jgi:chromosome segregation ATPase